MKKFHLWEISTWSLHDRPPLRGDISAETFFQKLQISSAASPKWFLIMKNIFARVGKMFSSLETISYLLRTIFGVFEKNVSAESLQRCPSLKGGLQISSILKWKFEIFFKLQNNLSLLIFVENTSKMVRLKAYDAYFGKIKKFDILPQFPLVSVAFEEGCSFQHFSTFPQKLFLNFNRSHRELRTGNKFWIFCNW